jgi:hypothetical protein
MSAATDRIVSFSAMVVGIAALGTAIYTAQIEREANRAAVLPYLTISLMANAEATNIVVRNAGVGPALLDEVHIRHRGRVLDLDPYDFFVAERGSDHTGLSVDKLLPGRLIASGEWVATLGSIGEAREELLGQLLNMFELGEVPDTWYASVGATRTGPDKAVIELTYKSVYGERWRVTSDRVVPERID